MSMKRRLVPPLAALIALALAACGDNPSVAYKELLDDDPQIRNDAAQRLGAARTEEAVDSLIAVLDDPVEMVRVQVVRSLGKIGDPRAIPALSEKVTDPLDSVRLQVSMALGEIGDPAAVEPLGKLLYDSNETTRLAAARSLGNIGTEEAMTKLVEVALMDEAELVRQHVVRVMGERDMKEAIPLLEDALAAESDKVRAKSAHVLGKLGDVSSVPALIQALEDPYYKTRSLAAHALSTLAPTDPDVLAALNRRLEIEEEMMTRVDIAWALARGGDRGSVDVVRDLLFRGEPEDVRAEAARALGEIGDESDLPRLEKAINDKKGLVRKEAYQAFQKLKEA